MFRIIDIETRANGEGFADDTAAIAEPSVELVEIKEAVQEVAQRAPVAMVQPWPSASQPAVAERPRRTIQWRMQPPKEG